MKPVIDGTGQCAWLWTEVCEIQGIMVHPPQNILRCFHVTRM
jgi:hypothetical protein